MLCTSVILFVPNSYFHIFNVYNAYPVLVVHCRSLTHGAVRIPGLLQFLTRQTNLTCPLLPAWLEPLLVWFYRLRLMHFCGKGSSRHLNGAWRYRRLPLRATSVVLGVRRLIKAAHVPLVACKVLRSSVF